MTTSHTQRIAVGFGPSRNRGVFFWPAPAQAGPAFSFKPRSAADGLYGLDTFRRPSRYFVGLLWVQKQRGGRPRGNNGHATHHGVFTPVAPYKTYRPGARLTTDALAAMEAPPGWVVCDLSATEGGNG